MDSRPYGWMDKKPCRWMDGQVCMWMDGLLGGDVESCVCTCFRSPGIVNLGMSASQFVELPPSRIDRFLTTEANPKPLSADPAMATPAQKRSMSSTHTKDREQQAIPTFFSKRPKTEAYDREVTTENEELISTRTDAVQDGQLIFCSRCKRKVPASDAQEHDDYHYALEIQRQMHKEQNSSGDHEGMTKSWTGSSGQRYGQEDCGSTGRNKRFGTDISDFFK